VGRKQRPAFEPVKYARAICEEFSLMYVPNDSMYVYREDGYWSPIHANYIEQCAMGKLGTEAKSSRCSDVRKMVELSCLIPASRAFNELNGHVNLKNGMLDLKTREIKPHSRDFLSTIQLQARYDLAAICPQWEQFLDEVFQGDIELIDLVQEFMGYSLVPDTSQEKALLFIGEGANGKSTLLRVWEHLLGPQNISSVTLAGLQNEFHRVTLQGKLLNITAEVNPMTVEQADYLKRVISGDTIDAAHKGSPVFTFRPFARLVFAMNRMPRVKDTSHGFYRRLLMVPFNRAFEGEDADRALSRKLVEEIDGIFRWTLQGLDRLSQTGSFIETVSGVAMLTAYKRANNPLVAFVQDACELAPGADSAKDALYGEYRKYCTEKGFAAASSETFFRELYAAFPDCKPARLGPQGARDHYVKGIKIVRRI
jgi:putative DNA primase/helicase